MKFKLIMLIIGTLILTSMASAQIEFPTSADEIYKTNTTISLSQSCFNNGTYCSGNAQCNVTIFSPNVTLLVNNQAMTNQISFHNYSLINTDTTSKGVYEYRILCQDGIYSNFESFNFEVTPTGTSPTIAQTLFYALMILLAVGFFLITLYGFLRIEWSNQRDPEGYLININDMKYVKIILFFFMYALLIWLSFLGMAVNNNFLYFDLGTNMFENIFYVLTAGIYPLILGLVAIGIISYINDKKLEEVFTRGLRTK